MHPQKKYRLPGIRWMSGSSRENAEDDFSSGDRTLDFFLGDKTLNLSGLLEDLGYCYGVDDLSDRTNVSNCSV
jgi:hypothetical protein